MYGKSQGMHWDIPALENNFPHLLNAIVRVHNIQ
jgi:hypothetical protein